MLLNGQAVDDKLEKEPVGVLELVLREQEDRQRSIHGEMSGKGTKLVSATCRSDGRLELDSLVMANSSPLPSTKLPSTSSASFPANP
mmetsp:Transcript_54435/g.176956  ORF Transcript_54435/g.176956 Transcript_54435/m.176956 type:complete len:87 (-) Transcript_54435:323-583(-)